jgi:hypothetical protein
MEGPWFEPKGLLEQPSRETHLCFFRVTVLGQLDISYNGTCVTRSFLDSTTAAIQSLANESPRSDPFTEASVLYSPTLPTYQSSISEADAEMLLYA